MAAARAAVGHSAGAGLCRTSAGEWYEEERHLAAPQEDAERRATLELLFEDRRTATLLSRDGSILRYLAWQGGMVRL